jgi:hypothetical protein
MLKRLSAGFTVLIIAACSSYPPADEKPMFEGMCKLRRDPYSTALIHSRAIAAPVGKFALLRKDASMCAVRITSFHCAHGAIPFAEYDWHFLSREDGNFTSAEVQSGHAILSLRQNVGIGRFSFQRGSPNIRCGSIVVGWGYPSSLSLIVVNNDGMHWNGIEIAPTAWSDITQVDTRNPKLKWYRHPGGGMLQAEEAQPLVEVPAMSLPGAQ